jgi:hypothetical protein
MNHLIRLSILIIIVGLLALVNGGLSRASGAQRADRSAVPEGDSTSYRLDWATVGETSGGDSASTSYRLGATIGQMGASTQSASAHFALCVGFQCAASEHHVFLPLMLK